MAKNIVKRELEKGKKEKEAIKKLAEDKEYEKIYQQYGQTAYLKYTPPKYIREDFNKLKKEGKYEDIYLKYGNVKYTGSLVKNIYLTYVKAKYTRLLVKAMYNEIKQENGLLKALLWKARVHIKDFTLYSLIVGTTLTLAHGANTTTSISENAQKYEKQIEEYNDSNEEYAKQFNNSNLSDLQIIMKTVDDMWNSIQGYKDPEINAIGYKELDVATPEGYGVCQNFAAHIAKRLNEINSKYNARTIIVYNWNGVYYQPDIDRNILEDNKDTDFLDAVHKVTFPVAGNHEVTLIDIPEDNIILCIDPTNPGIGLYNNGIIKMFNEPEDVFGNILIPKEIFSILRERGYLDTPEVLQDYVNSFKIPRYGWKRLEDKYGLAAQEKALEEVREFFATKTDSTNVERTSFDNRIKLGIDQNVQNSYSQSQNTTNQGSKEIDEK